MRWRGASRRRSHARRVRLQHQPQPSSRGTIGPASFGCLLAGVEAVRDDRRDRVGAGAQQRGDVMAAIGHAAASVRSRRNSRAGVGGHGKWPRPTSLAGAGTQRAARCHSQPSTKRRTVAPTRGSRSCAASATRAADTGQGLLDTRPILAGDTALASSSLVNDAVHGRCALHRPYRISAAPRDRSGDSIAAE